MTLCEQLRSQCYRDRVTTLRVLVGQLAEDLALVPHAKIVSGLLGRACEALALVEREIERRPWAAQRSDRRAA